MHDRRERHVPPGGRAIPPGRARASARGAAAPALMRSRDRIRPCRQVDDERSGRWPGRRVVNELSRVKRPPIPPDEAARLAALRRTGLLDTPPEAAFDDLTQLAALLCGA